MIIKDGEPDGMGGIAAVILCSVFLVVLLLVPSRPGGKFYMAGLALMGIGWGVRQIRAAKAQDKQDADAANKKDTEKDA